VKEGFEDNLSSTESWKSEPEGKNEFKCVVEWEPVDSIDCALEESQECENNPVGQPLCIVGLAHAEQGLKRVVPWDSKPSQIREELTSDVEEDQEEVGCDDPEEGIGLRDVCLPL